MHPIHLPSLPQVPPLYILDATDPAQWDAKVRRPAEAVVQAMMEGQVPDLKQANPPPDPDTANRTRSKWEEDGKVESIALLLIFVSLVVATDLTPWDMRQTVTPGSPLLTFSSYLFINKLTTANNNQVVSRR